MATSGSNARSTRASSRATSAFALMSTILRQSGTLQLTAALRSHARRRGHPIQGTTKC